MSDLNQFGSGPVNLLFCKYKSVSCLSGDKSGTLSNKLLSKRSAIKPVSYVILAGMAPLRY